MTEVSNKDLDLIKYNPKKAVIVLAIPLMIAVFVELLNDVVDGIWVGALGPQALSATEFVSPLFLVLIAIGLALSAGTVAVMSKYMGEGNKEKAENVAMHAILLVVILSIVIPIFLLVFLDPVLIMLGAKDVLPLAEQYGFFIIVGIYSLIIPNVLQAVFLAEGKGKHATIPLIVATIINILLDPIMIYTFDFGIAGASMSNMIAQTLFALLPMIYWIFIKKSTYLDINFKKFKLNLGIYKELLFIAIPVYLEQFFVSFLTILIHMVLAAVGIATSVAIFSASWKFINLGMGPAIAIGTAMVTVLGYAYGAKNWDNFKMIFNYSIKIAFIVSLIFAVVIFVFSKDIAGLFGTDPTFIKYTSDAIRTMILIIPLTSWGMIGVYYLQTVGKGAMLLVLTFLKEVVLTYAFMIFFASFDISGHAVGLGVTVGYIIGALILYLYSRYDVKRILKSNIS